MLHGVVLLLLTTAAGPSRGTRAGLTDNTAKQSISITQNRSQLDSSLVAKGGRQRLGRIIGGSDAISKDYPYQVAWMMNGQFMCGGSVLSPDWIISAAHCFPSGNDTQGSSFHVGSAAHTTPGGATHYPVAFYQNPGWTTDGMDWDIGLIRVEPPIHFNDNVKPIRIVDSHQVLQEGDTFTVTGWGLTTEHGGGASTLQKVNINLVNHTKCVEVYKQYTVTDRMLCAQAPHKDACQGDSGGPLVINAETDNTRLAALVSWGSGCASPKYPGVFTDLRHPGVRRYIESVTGWSLKDPVDDNSRNQQKVPGASDASGSACGASTASTSSPTHRREKDPHLPPGRAGVTEWLQTMLRSSAANMIDHSLTFLPDGLQLPDATRPDSSKKE